MFFLLDYLFHEKMQYKNLISMNPIRLTVLILVTESERKKKL